MNDRKMPEIPELRVVEPADPDLLTGRGHGAHQAAVGTAPSHSGARKVGLAAMIVLAAALGYGAGRHTLQENGVAAAAERQREFVPTVRAAAVRPTSADVIVTLPATTSAFEAADVYARASGYISRRAVDIGDHVTAGQLLAEITAPELDDQIGQAEATLSQLEAAQQQAQANLDLAQVTWDRDRPLVAKGWVTQQQGTIDMQTLKAQQAAVGVARDNVVAQEAQLRVLHQQKNYQRVIAPFNGIITQRNIDVGSLAQADAASGTFLFTVMRSNVMRIQVYVPQSEAVGLGPGIDAVLRVPEMPDHTFSGKVTRIADALQPGTRTLLTEIDVPNSDAALSPGMYGTVELHIPRKTPATLVLADSIIFNGDGVQIAVVESGTAHLRRIEIARDFGRDVEVRDGLRPGDQVILNPPVDLADGAKVHIQSEPPT